jgi:hypothetical protein
MHAMGGHSVTPKTEVMSDMLRKTFNVFVFDVIKWLSESYRKEEVSWKKYNVKK